MSKLSIFVLVCLFTVLFCGCYDNREVDTVATVMAVGIEKSSNRNEKLYTFALSDIGGYNSDSKGDAASLICYSASGRDIESAIYELDKKISKSLSFSHVSAIFFSKEIAKEGMYTDAHFFEKDFKVRPQVILALCEMSPRKYLENLSPRLESNPEKYFRSIFQKSGFYVPPLKLCDFTDSYHCGETSAIALISGGVDGKKISEESVKFSSVGIVSKGRLTAELNDEFLPGLFFSKKKVKLENAVVKSIDKPQVSVKIKNGNANVRIKLNVRADKSVNTLQIATSLEKILGYHAKMGIDIINISRYGKKGFFTLNGYRKTNWNELIKNADFQVYVNVVKGDL